MTDNIIQSKGSRQGGIIETLEFIFYYQEIINQINKEVDKFEVEYIKGKRINNCVLVDDLTCLHMSDKSISKSIEEFQLFTNIVKKAIDSVLLDINVKKTGFTIHNYGKDPTRDKDVKLKELGKA